MGSTVKSIPITPEVQARINAAAGTEVNPNTVVAYECLAFSREPIKKPGSIFNGSVADPGFYGELATHVNSGKSVPLHIMHMDHVLPSGRVFHAAETEDGTRAQFYVPAQKPFNEDIENGLIGSVSIGALSKHLLCSKCQWDYRGPEATIMNFIDQKCANDHVLGDEGTHLISKGLENWFELSLCGTGASPNAKILSRSKALLSQDALSSLAASGTSPEAVIMVTPPLGEDDMTTKELTDKIEEQAGKVATLTASVAAAETKAAADAAKITELEAKLVTADAEKVALTAKHDTAVATLATVQGAQATVVAELTLAKTFLKDQVTKGLVAAGGKAPETVPDSAAELIASLTTSGKNIANLVAAQTNIEKERTNGAKTAASPSSAFKSRS